MFYLSSLCSDIAHKKRNRSLVWFWKTGIKAERKKMWQMWVMEYKERGKFSGEWRVCVCMCVCVSSKLCVITVTQWEVLTAALCSVGGSSLIKSSYTSHNEDWDSRARAVLIMTPLWLNCIVLVLFSSDVSIWPTLLWCLGCLKALLWDLCGSVLIWCHLKTLSETKTTWNTLFTLSVHIIYIFISLHSVATKTLLSLK